MQLNFQQNNATTYVFFFLLQKLMYIKSYVTSTVKCTHIYVFASMCKMLMIYIHMALCWNLIEVKMSTE